MNTGVYWITCSVSGTAYIGSTASGLRKRWQEHKRDLIRQRHRNRHLQNAWNKYGADAFKFETLELCSPELCVQREQDWLDFCAENHIALYNLTMTAGSVLGMKFGPLSEERKSIVSAANKGRKLSEEHKAAIKASNVGRVKTPEEIAKLVAVHKGKKRSAETCRRIGEKSKGRVPSAEARAKMSASRKGKKRPEEFGRKISEALTGRKRSEGDRQRMRDGRRKAAEAREATAAVACESIAPDDAFDPFEDHP